MVKAGISKQVESSQSQFSPLPGWLLVACGINSGSGASSVPFVDFTFNKGTKWKDGAGKLHGVPDQFIIDAGYTPAETRQPAVPLPSINDVVNYQVENVQAHKGTAGILGGLKDPSAIYDTSYKHDTALTVYDSIVPAYSLELPSGLPLSRFAAAALESLPLTYTPQTKVVFELFIRTFGNTLSSEAVFGGRCSRQS